MQLRRVIDAREAADGAAEIERWACENYLRKRAAAYLECTNEAGPGCNIMGLSECGNDFMCSTHPALAHHKLIAEELIRCADVMAKRKKAARGAV